MAAFTGTPVNSDLMADQKDADSTGARADSLATSAGVHAAYAEYTHSSTAGTGTGAIDMFRLPAGRLRILCDQSRVVTSAFASNADLHIGYRAHTDLDGDAVVEDDNAFSDNLDAGGGALDVAWALPTGGILELNSEEGVDIYCLVDTGNIEATDTINLLCLYQMM